MQADYSVVLVLSGGNALGAFQGGAYEALEDRGVNVDWVVGASIGAINGAIICGGAPGARLARLREFWRAPDGIGDHTSSSGPLETARRTLSVQTTFGMGQPHIFSPRRLFGPWWEPFGNGEPSSLYDNTPLVGTLAGLVDFERLNAGSPRLSVTAVDIESGEDVVFDTRVGALEPDHVRASSALLPLFPPVQLGGRLYADAGLSANLPVDVVLEDPPQGATLCLAIDLAPLHGRPPETLGNAAERMQDLVFASQSKRAISHWQRYYDLRGELRSGASDENEQRAITLVHMAYANQQPEVCGKMFDYSPASAAHRWEEGYRTMTDVLDRVQTGELPIGKPGLTVHSAFGPER